MRKVITLILIAILAWGLLPARHKLGMRSCNFSYYYTSPDGCGPWRVSYFWDYGWLVKAVRGGK